MTPFMPQINEVVFQTTSGGVAGQPSECDLVDQIVMSRLLVCAIKLVQTRLLSEPGKK